MTVIGSRYETSSQYAAGSGFLSMCLDCHKGPVKVTASHCIVCGAVAIIHCKNCKQSYVTHKEECDEQNSFISNEYLSNPIMRGAING